MPEKPEKSLAEQMKELKSISPEERLRKLKEIEEKNRKEIEAAQKLMKDTEAELKEQNELREKIPIPQVTAGTIEQLQTAEEKAMFVRVRQISGRQKEETSETEAAPAQEESESLETITAAAPALENLPAAAQEYVLNLSQQPFQALYQEMRTFHEAAAERGYLSADQMSRITYLGIALEQKVAAIETGQYKTPSEEIAEKTSAIQQWREDMQRMYHAESYTPRQTQEEQLGKAFGAREARKSAYGVDEKKGE